ncbi:MAG TPA: DUF4893 domain-containing protein [Allosphingosinicella sp.]|nr:DUF4893 domain-containing protein [Allosphingosinicella sp.]
MKPVIIPMLAALGCAASGCSTGSGSLSTSQLTDAREIVDWRQIATPSDRARLREWRTAWVEGLSKAQAAGHAGALLQEGPLLQPDAAIDWQTPPPGTYQCRVLKIGAKSQGMLDYVAYPSFTCRLRIEDGLMSFAKLTGSQRPLGLFLPDNNRRMVFLGTLQLGDEKLALQYGRDRERDVAGVVERVGEQRWRIAFPYPHFESTIDVIELVPTRS